MDIPLHCSCDPSFLAQNRLTDNMEHNELDEYVLNTPIQLNM